ncbi:MAG: zinc-ribbon domain-containing protein [Zoogloeaceae bacterium]|jgi:predicted Zn finger-like uncharacterized protein|nr:zinc-ribbon domain-containing protein [Zoogloeaceae bacterium]
MMLTRCPACGTTFRVTTEQIKARSGRVRCGHCRAVFDALKLLQEDATPTIVGGPSLPLLRDPPPAAPRFAVYAWAVVCLLALILLLAQAAYIFRAELALAHPGWRPQLEALCQRLDCEVPLPRKTDLLDIDGYDLRADPRQKRLLALAATLKNRAAFTQAYPHLEVTLTDAYNQPMIRKVLAPPDYLPQGADINAGFPANADIAINLRLDAGIPGASGYQLYLFYP